MRDKPWAVIDLLDSTAETKWYERREYAEMAHRGEAVIIRYLPGKKKKVKK